MRSTINIFWFRRDLRLADNAGLYHALKASLPVVPIFIFDRDILDKLEDKADRRVQFIHDALQVIQQKLSDLDSTLEVYYGYPVEIFEKLSARYNIDTVFANHDYEPYGIERDDRVRRLLAKKYIPLKTYKDHVIFEKSEVVKDSGEPYTVFTPYSRKWRSTLTDFCTKSYPTKEYFNFYKQAAIKILTLSEIGFEKVDMLSAVATPEKDLIRHYHKQRDYPGLDGTSRMGVHLRFGTISIRQLIRLALELNSTYLNELVWREFYQMILWHFPHVAKGLAFKPKYDKIPWRNNEDEFERWCSGTTGYAIVDAGMRELNATGFMHNRIRMVVASFLTKHLLIDWRWGEAYFAAKLLDYEFASNNGGWQWAAGSGCDAAPYFRVFNPYLQTKKFDPDLKYVRKWVPEFEDFSYPSPIVDHDFARKRAIEVYRKALNET